MRKAEFAEISEESRRKRVGSKNCPEIPFQGVARNLWKGQSDPKEPRGSPRGRASQLNLTCLLALLGRQVADIL